MKNKIAFCVTGWHFPTNFYSRIKDIPNIDIFIVCHKSKNDLPAIIQESFPPESILLKPNFGYDWGCFQQFLETNIWRSYEYVFFMHDDINILNSDFVEPCLELLRNGFSLVGNGRPFDKRDWPRTHLPYYAHSAWKPPSANFEHDIVRGSFFVTNRETLDKMGSFEVFWDKFRLSIGFGNYSLLATCGKFSDTIGQKSFAFLSDQYRSSKYIMEFERGNDSDNMANHKKKNRDYLFNSFFMSWFKMLCTSYTLSVINQPKDLPENIKQKIMRKIIQLFAGRSRLSIGN
jgi:hypothetical protein